MKLNIFFVIVGARACLLRKWRALWSVAEYSMEETQSVCVCVHTRVHVCVLSDDRRRGLQPVGFLPHCHRPPLKLQLSEALQSENIHLRTNPTSSA